MPTRYTGGKKKPAKKGSKGGSKGGGGTTPSGGGGEGIVDANEPIIVAGGGSASLKFNKSQFKDKGSHFKNDAANIVSVSIDGGTPIPLSPTSTVQINFR